MLELRLREHNDHVDYFILVEGTKTFSGRPKPLYFEKNKDRFKPWENKIIHLIISDFPEDKDNTNDQAWEREYYTRNFTLSTLAQICAPNDLILHSDCDEIISGDILRTFKELPDQPPHCLQTVFYYYNCNWKKSNIWERVFIGRYKDIQTTGLLSRP